MKDEIKDEKVMQAEVILPSRNTFDNKAGC